MPLKRHMRSLPLSQIKLTDPFWTRWQKVLVKTTLPQQYGELEKTGRLTHFRRVAGLEEGKFDGYCFNDSDVYKWLEACAYGLANYPSEELKIMVDRAVNLIVAAQEDSGYLNTFFQLNHPTLKWRNLNAMHEMYCAGHLIEAGVAMFECLGDRRLLDVSIRFADHIMSIFGPDKRLGYAGHEEIELALVKLANATGEKNYAEFALWMIEQRGQRPSPLEAEMDDTESLALSPYSKKMLYKDGKYSGEYLQDHAPIREHNDVVGHAVRAMYLYIAAADLLEGTEDVALETALTKAWKNLTGRRMYITGGIGPSGDNEGFTNDFDLPNLTAYAETCAAIGLAFWGHQMLEMTADSEYADVMERAIYNGALSGISLSGDKYFYTNPLESRGTHARTPWFPCACCPPNIARMIGNLGKYACGASADTFFLHMPVGLNANLKLGGVATNIAIESNYPHDGKIVITVSPARPTKFTLAIRVPGWCDNVDTDLPGATEEAEYATGYMIFDRVWQPGEKLTIDFEMEPKWVESDPRVRDNLGRTALTRGPLVYCAEEHEAEFAPQLFVADLDAPIEAESSTMLEGVMTLKVEGTCDVELFPDDLYAEIGAIDTRETSIKFIPYYTWNNRGATNMQVWTRHI
ncbi:glycoside hydrolase family 127 protein [soil metagenome]